MAKPKCQLKLSAVWVTPKIAKAWMARLFDDQRNVNKANQDRIERAMMGGTWLMTGEPLMFNESGDLINGQHRLLALIATGYCGWFIIVENVPDAAYHVIDYGKKRSMADAFKSQKYESPILLSQSAALMSNILNRTLITKKGHHTFDGLRKVVDDNPGIKQSLSMADKRGLVRIMKKPVVSTLHHLFSSTNKKKAESFFKVLETGFAERTDDPAFVLREKLLDTMAYFIKSNNSDRVSRDWVVAITIKAWGSYVKNKGISPKDLDYKKSESFPDIPRVKYLVD